MLFEYITKTGQSAKIEAADAKEALAKATNIDPHSGVSLSVNQVDNSKRNLDPLPPTTPVEKSLPPTSTNTTSRLLEFSSALDTATKIAQKKRLDFQSNILKQGVAPGVRSASDFSGVLSSIDNQDQSFVKPLVDTALDVAKTSGADITAVAKSATLGNAPDSVISKIIAAPDLASALILAKPYIKDDQSGGTTKFTTTQLNSGAANAGVTPDEFKGFDDNTKNIFINGDLNSSKKLLDKEIENGATQDEIASGLTDLKLPPKVHEYLTKYAAQKLEENKPTSPEDQKKTIVQTLKDLETSGYARDEAESTIRNALTDDGKTTLPETIDTIIGDAVVEVFGQSFWQKILPGGR